MCKNCSLSFYLARLHFRGTLFDQVGDVGASSMKVTMYSSENVVTDGRKHVRLRKLTNGMKSFIELLWHCGDNNEKSDDNVILSGASQEAVMLLCFGNIFEFRESGNIF